MNLQKKKDIHNIFWKKESVLKRANSENIVLTSDHWKVIVVLRSLYINFNTAPNLRILINMLKKKYKNEKWNSVFIFNLFPKGVIRQASYIAGLPKKYICL
ncbi:TusE/DsrC/DsvC family sulfur relay protein [Enterobacteriaceae endosymbiont of Donacia tomentosa]|uniref:TusE/DsrC/DsvC family sulfur relay protein n=1 Tax=Enterobacteriaceae endosymbiont of Donacia tomentosa TaxID=2675787 RepID=UPI001448DB19|nr:TusE/DsrC/DsvC family sulfur relay protein [Enterobacteriaceae endosymbiont of Donacia tomentosa]QJC31474.1 TusE/DsrC/DsvC family sulfur relay protein [Enterobacteriaceae endosymbiont of Donacia tomentosa]